MWVGLIQSTESWNNKNIEIGRIHPLPGCLSWTSVFFCLCAGTISCPGSQAFRLRLGLPHQLSWLPGLPSADLHNHMIEFLIIKPFIYLLLALFLWRMLTNIPSKNLCFNDLLQCNKPLQSLVTQNTTIYHFSSFFNMVWAQLGGFIASYGICGGWKVQDTVSLTCFWCLSWDGWNAWAIQASVCLASPSLAFLTEWVA